MQDTSARWPLALPYDCGMSTKVNVLYDGAVTAEDIEIVSGTVDVDAGSQIRRGLSLTIPDPEDLPRGATDTYGVYGQRIYVESGLRYPDGSTERVPVGTFVLTDVAGDPHLGPLTLTGAGLEILLQREIIEAAFSTASFTDAAALINTLIGDRFADIGFVDSSSRGDTALPTKTWDPGATLLTIITDVATAVGAEFYADASGTFRLSDVPEVGTYPLSADWDVSAGEGGLMVSADIAVSADGVYNRVVVTGENTSDDTPPVQGTATITDPADPLVYGGPYGRVTYRTTSDLATTSTTATAMANALLERRRAPNRTVSLATLPNPALDVRDWIRVGYAGGVPPELHLVQRFTVPLSVADASSFAIETVGGQDAVAGS